MQEIHIYTIFMLSINTVSFINYIRSIGLKINKLLKVSRESGPEDYV